MKEPIVVHDEGVATLLRDALATLHPDYPNNLTPEQRKRIEAARNGQSKPMAACPKCGRRFRKKRKLS
jgi:hypothetical protein